MVTVAITCCDTRHPTMAPSEAPSESEGPTEEPTHFPTIAPTEQCTSLKMDVQNSHNGITTYNGIFNKQLTTINGTVGG